MVRLIGSCCVESLPLSSLVGARWFLWPLWISLDSLRRRLALPSTPIRMPCAALGICVAPFRPPWGGLWALAGTSLTLTVQADPTVDVPIDFRKGIIGWELIQGFPGCLGFCGSGDNNYGSGLPFHTRPETA
jgi:hypothetical protein